MNVVSCSDLDHENDQHVILDLVEDPVAPPAHAVDLPIYERQRLCEQLHARSSASLCPIPIRARILSQSLNLLQDALDILLGQAAEVLPDGLLELQAISCHPLSGPRAAPRT